MSSNPQIKQQSKIQLVKIVDILLLLFCCVVIAGRCQISETLLPARNGPIGTAQVSQLTIGGAGTMIILATLTIAAFALWLLIRAIKGQLIWRPTWLIAPTIIIIIAGIAATYSASNKHTAIIGTLNVAAYLLLAILLVQLANQPWKRRLILCVIAATGVSMAYRCWEQHQYEMPATEQEYAQNQTEVLTRQGIQPGTYAAQQFAERLNSQDVGGYFSISNSAAAFFILTIMATGAAIAIGAKGSISRQKWLWLILAAAILLTQLAGLALTKSKGGIAGLLAAVMLAGLFGAAANWLAKRWRLWLTVALALIILAMAAIAVYGITHHRLPTASMWVRWQYWQATARMIADHWLTGVGPENFGQYYPQYMNPAAPEVVKDPHSMWLALWSQWGTPALLAAIWATLAVTIAIIRPCKRNQKNRDIHDCEPATCSNFASPKSGWLLGLIILAGIIILRAATSTIAASANQWHSIVLLWFIVPGIVWLGSFIIMWHAIAPSPTDATKINYPLILLGCGLLGFLLHNSIDFAIWQPGIASVFMALIAVAVAIKTGHKQKTWPITNWSRIGMVIAAIGLTIVLCVNIIFPIVKSQLLLNQAQNIAAQGSPAAAEQAKRLAMEAARTNNINPAPWQFMARVNTALWYGSAQTDDVSLNEAIANLEEVVKRDPARAAGFRQLGRLCDAAALAATTENQQQQYQSWAKNYWAQALDRSPGDADILIRNAEILQQNNRPQQALAIYLRALAIDNAFLEMQSQMYPHRTEPYRRLTLAQRMALELRIKELAPNTP